MNVRKVVLALLFLAAVGAPSRAFVAETPLFQFVQISDSHIRAAGVDPNREATLISIIDKINSMPTLPAFVMITGDLTENGLAEEYQNFKNIMTRLNPAVGRHYLPGNHETMSGTWADFQAQIGPLYSSFTYMNCMFILTNGSRDDAPNYHEDGFIDATQLQWIQTQLQAAGSMTHVVMANHYPLGTQWGLYSVIDPALSTLQGWMRDYKVTAWLNGHRHFDAFYADTTFQTSHILCGVTTGYGGFAGPGYRLNSVYTDRIVSDRIPVYTVPNPSFVEPAGPYICPNPRAGSLPPPAMPPRPDHVVIVIEENKAAGGIIGNTSAPYINSLANQGASFTQSFAVTHPSQPNYLALFSGSTQGVTDDVVPPVGSQYTTPNLGAALLAKSLSFGGYSETMPSVGFLGGSAGTAPATYQRKHNPWSDWQGTGTNQLPPLVNMPFAGSFPADFSQLPTVSFVIPNQLNDMHDGTIAQGDAWLQSNLDAYVQWAKTHNSLLIVTFDEDDFTSVNQISTIFVGPMVKPGQYSETINHYNVLRTIEDMYGLSHAGAAGSSTAILDCWQGVAATVTTPPANLTVTVGQTAGFSVTASGTGPLSYQWQKNGVTIAGATSSAYTTPATMLADSGSTYRCVVSNAFGSAGSASATLTVNPATPTPGLVAQWKLDEVSGTTASDASGYGNVGTLLGGTSWTSGRIGGALGFNGVDGYVSVPPASSLSLTTFTAALWVKPQATKSDWQPLLTKEASNGTHRNYGLYIYPNQMRVHYSFQAADGATWRSYTSVGSMTLGAWNHVAMTYDGTSFKFYLNGSFDSSATIVSSVCQNSEPVKLGRELGGWTAFNGLLDDVRLYNIALTGQDISTLAHPPVTDPTLLAWWKLDDASGSTAADASGKGNSGTLIHGPTWTAGKLGGALSFSSGLAQAVTLPKVLGLAEGNTPHTISAWIKVNSLPTQRAWILLLGNPERGSHHWLINNTGFTQFGAWNATQENPVLPVGQWRHVAITFDGWTLTGYVDGVSIGSQGAYFNLKGAPLTLAQAYVGENYFDGVLDDVRIYSRALSAQEVVGLLTGP